METNNDTQQSFNYIGTSEIKKWLNTIINGITWDNVNATFQYFVATGKNKGATTSQNTIMI